MGQTSHPESLHEYIGFAHRLAKTSGERILQYYRKDVSIDLKADDSPVTIADREAEELIRALILSEYPDHGIIGEEFGNTNPAAEYTWVIDPIDGTKSFIAGTPLFGTLISLAQNGEPLLGVIHLPALNELYTGTNGYAERNGSAITFRECGDVGSAVLLTTDHKDAEELYGKDKLRSLISGSRYYRTWGDCYGYSLLCSGYADAMIDPVLQPWDMYALLPVIRGAGGIVTNKDGGDPLKSGNIVAAHPSLHAQILRFIG